MNRDLPPPSMRKCDSLLLMRTGPSPTKRPNLKFSICKVRWTTSSHAGSWCDTGGDQYYLFYSKYVIGCQTDDPILQHMQLEYNHNPTLGYSVADGSQLFRLPVFLLSPNSACLSYGLSHTHST